MLREVDKRLTLNIRREMEAPSRIKRLLAGLMSDLKIIIADTRHIDEFRIQSVVNDFVQKVVLLFPQHFMEASTSFGFSATRATYHCDITLNRSRLSIDIAIPAFEYGLVVHGHSLQS